MDPIGFVREHLSDRVIDADEFHGVKQNVVQLNEEVQRLKSELAKITSILTKSTPSKCTSVGDHAKIDHNAPNQSMENNVANEDESALCDDAAINPDAVSSNEKSHNEIVSDAFTMEIIEVDVVAQASMELLPSVEVVEAINDNAQNNETNSNLTMNISELESTVLNEDDSGADFDESHNESAYSTVVLIENDISGEGVEFTHASNAEIMIEDAPSDDAGPTTIDCPMASTPQKSMAETTADDAGPQMDINIEDLPIVMKADYAEDQV